MKRVCATLAALALTGGIAWAQSSGSSSTGGAGSGGTASPTSPTSPANARLAGHRPGPRRVAVAGRQLARAVRSRHHRPRAGHQPGQLAGRVAPGQSAGPDAAARHQSAGQPSAGHAADLRAGAEVVVMERH